MTHETARPQCLRRDFLVGPAAGMAVAMGVGRAAALARPPGFPDGATPSYAQCGEDVAARELLGHKGVERPTYLDVGAFRPIHYNNTYLFHTLGGRGVLVEPNVALADEIRAARPGDVLLTVGIGLEGQTTADLYCLTLPEWNTFDREEAERNVKGTGGRVRIEKVVKTPLIPINTVIADHFHGEAPDFLSIDVESLDLPILRTLDFDRFRPRVICAETVVPLAGRMAPDVAAFLTTKGYQARAMTFANTLFVDRAWFGEGEEESA
ncbi:MAG: FkbM family methyltransferase [Isosphaeraceae bacterium]